MITLFGTTNCPQCERTKQVLAGYKLEYVLMDSYKDREHLALRCNSLNINLSEIKANPVMVTDDMVYTGDDCWRVIEEGLI